MVTTIFRIFRMLLGEFDRVPLSLLHGSYSPVRVERAPRKVRVPFVVSPRMRAPA